MAFLPLTSSAPDAECARPAVKMKLVARAEGKPRKVTAVMFSVPAAQWEWNDEILQLVFPWSFFVDEAGSDPHSACS